MPTYLDHWHVMPAALTRVDADPKKAAKSKKNKLTGTDIDIAEQMSVDNYRRGSRAEKTTSRYGKGQREFRFEADQANAQANSGDFCDPAGKDVTGVL
jgi:hypothetical protein